ncbi:glycosyltransferase family 2 protein [Salinimicrobium sp. HB62]|uniref:glycosyltransferase family 2 protein n=1 Tax=Salinimicrobium sp. HB62 TaxID=3077781 RepID=UPI002D7688E6|nr:glycosyltransferase family A protein [Salinimicrobium sp. HB62]
MEKRFSIIYANRNRDPERIRKSFESLEKQTASSFQVIFVDYGSTPKLIPEYQKTAEDFPFVKTYFLNVSQVLWNKSKALNYGIRKAVGDYIFIADVDLIFHPEALSLFEQLAGPEKFSLFKLGYLSKKESEKLKENYSFEQLKPARYGTVNGMILADKKALQDVEGLDEFFHFYGAEDEDLVARLENGGYKRERVDAEYFYHNWHLSFSGSEDELLTGNPRVKNIMRLNQRHFQRNRELGIIKSSQMGEVISTERSVLLKDPTKNFRVKNILAHVEHFLRVELPSLKGEVVKVEFVEDPYFNSFKYRIKKLLRKQTQPYISMKEVNDMLLKEIVFCYRDYNYSFKVEDDLKRISFSIAL